MLKLQEGLSVAIKSNFLGYFMKLTKMRVIFLALYIQKITNFPLSHSNAASQLMVTPARISAAGNFDHTYQDRCRGIRGMRSFTANERR